MILAEKIIEERKKNGWTQEELADKLSVSRQAISKWESAGSVPDLQRIIQLADLFGVSTDYLLKDEMTLKHLKMLLHHLMINPCRASPCAVFPWKKLMSFWITRGKAHRE